MTINKTTATRKPFRDLSIQELQQVKGGEDAPPPPPPTITSPRDTASGQATGKRSHQPLR